MVIIMEGVIQANTQEYELSRKFEQPFGFLSPFFSFTYSQSESSLSLNCYYFVRVCDMQVSATYLLLLGSAIPAKRKTEM